MSPLTTLANSTTVTLQSITLSNYGSAGNCDLFVKATVYADGTAGSGHESETDEIYTAVRFASGPTYTLDVQTRSVKNHGGSTITASSTLDISSGSLRVRYAADIDGEGIPGPIYAFCVVELTRLT